MTATQPVQALKIGVHSEVGQLREVMVHRPGTELDRLTPSNAGSLLFDDVMWAGKAREEHDEFAAVLEARGARVHHFGSLLAQALATPAGRAFAVERTCTEERFGAALAGDLAKLFEDTSPEFLADYLIGGVLKSDLSPLSTRSLAWESLAIDDFVITPVPNTLFQRDNTAWIGHSATVNPMATSARRRESINTRTVYHHHPLFASADFCLLYGDDDLDHTPATLEGGDVHVLDHDTVMVGMGERTTPTGVETLARRLFSTSTIRRLIAVELPKARSAMHLDTMLTMIDVQTFVAYPYLDDATIRHWTLTPGPDGAIEVQARVGLATTLGEALGRDDVRILKAVEDPKEAEREQWNDADNFLAVAPGVVLGYERNVVTNSMLESHGIEVIPLRGNELGRGRGGARCMSCPIHRDPIGARPSQEDMS